MIPFAPLATERLVLRPFTPDDVPLFHRRRTDPDVARYMNYTLPFPLERAERIVRDCIALGGPANDEWWNGMLTLAASGDPVGDVAVHLTNDARTAEIGYTIDPPHQGCGYAVEAVASVVDRLFEEVGVTRVSATLHPDNVASAQVLERTGFLYEGHLRRSCWVGEDNQDDLIYGLPAADRTAWRTRNTAPARTVRLIEITPENVYAVRALKTHHSQTGFVSPVTESLADALVPELVDGAPVVPWFCAIEADGELAGFLMVAEVTPHHPEPFLWRLLVDRLHQRRGIAGKALDLLEARLRGDGATTLLTSWGEGRGSPGPFYLARGFEPTGEQVDGETEARKRL